MILCQNYSDNTDIIINRWYEIFGKEEDDENQ